MLEIRPNCELCDKDLPSNSSEAQICTYECTFCRPCVKQILKNVCPNCGGGFCDRPIRPVTAWREGVGLTHQPASEQRVHSKFEREKIATFVAQLEHVSPSGR